MIQHIISHHNFVPFVLYVAAAVVMLCLQPRRKPILQAPAETRWELPGREECHAIRSDQA